MKIYIEKEVSLNLYRNKIKYKIYIEYVTIKESI